MIVKNSNIQKTLDKIGPYKGVVDKKGCKPILIKETGDIYIGEWKNDKRHGVGQQYYKDGSYYHG